MSDPVDEAHGMKSELPPIASAPQPVAGVRGIWPAQLDLTLPTLPTPRRAARRQRPCSRERAQWWFAQMRRVVDEGREVKVAGVW